MAEPVLRLKPERQRSAKRVLKLFGIIARSDQRLYGRGTPFTPTFPTDDAELQAALTLVTTRLNYVLSIT